MHTFSKSEFSDFLRDACRAHGQAPGAEICGLIIDTGLHLTLVQIRNVSRRLGSHVFSRPHIRRVVAAAKTLRHEVVGTFHSHPVAPAIPGESDIANTVDDSLMLIFDCIAGNGRLWRIKNGKARELDFATQRVPSPR